MLHKWQQQIDPSSRGESIYEWKAKQINNLFKKNGVTKKTGKIEASTIRHGLEEFFKNFSLDCLDKPGCVD